MSHPLLNERERDVALGGNYSKAMRPSQPG